MGSRIWRSSLLYLAATNPSRACVGSALLRRLSSGSIAAIHIGPGVISGTMWTRSLPVQSGCSERVGKDKWKWGGGHAAAAWR
jgi:hypothetical protein